MAGLLLAVGLLVAPVGSGEATAQSGPTVSIESQEATVGDPVDVPVEINGFGEIGAISLTITYDPAVLSFPEETSTGGLISGAPRDDFTANVVEPGEIRISWFDASSPIPGEDGVLLQLKFSTYEGGESSIAFGMESEMGGPQASAYGASYQDGEVKNATTPIDVSVRRQFEDAADSSDYELVALPGQPGVALDETVTGERGTGWRGFGEGGASGGSGEANLQECVPGAPCTFQSGNGFWVISQSDWSFQGTVPGVPAESDLPSIPLQDGWNIVSNPLQQDLSWASVQSENGLNETLWRWADGGEWEKASTLSSSVGGEAYYLFNGAGLDSLDLPLIRTGSLGPSSAPAKRRVSSAASSSAASGSAAPSSAAPSSMGLSSVASSGMQDGSYSGLRDHLSQIQRKPVSLGAAPNADATASERAALKTKALETEASKTKAPEKVAEWTLEIHAEVGGKRAASVTLGKDPSIEKQETYRAPPGYFSETTLHATGEGGSPKFARQILPAGAGSFSLLLKGRPDSDVRLVATGLSSLGARRPVLVEEKTGETHDLRAEPSAVISLPEGEGEAPLLLHVREK
ncbi:cohesin domain-containing protein [Salinibacter ruber]|uniref:cohesin domain-containing protein n=1 Tax=Salinibacter ruber TaxID=146919 RepID=UPI000C9F7D9A|nr:cohesin domain-containing protein [Salinibacter ruber]